MAFIPDYAVASPGSKVSLLRALLRAGLGAVGLVGCALGGQLIPPLRVGLGGRDFWPGAANSAFLILVLALTLRGALRWRIVDFIAALVPVELIALLTIAWFSGLELFDPFNLSWLADVSVLIAGPWLAGLLLGSAVLWFRNRRQNTTPRG